LNLSNCAGITEVIIWNSNKLQEINLWRNTELTHLEIDAATHLKYLDLTKNNQLERLYISEAAFTSIDLSKNSELTRINVYGENLEKINLNNYNNKAIESLNIAAPILSCFQVDDALWSATNWSSHFTYSEDCY